jgi:hypothetical protein
MRTVPRVCVLLLAMGLYAVTGNAQVSRAVVVSHSGSQINVTVNRSAPLGTVLDEICRESNAQCDGTEQALGVMVPAQQVSGDWRRVLSSLLDGTDLNYATREPAGSSAAVLSITSIAPRAVREPRVARLRETPTRAGSTDDAVRPAPAVETAASMSSSSGDSSAETTSRPEAVSTGSASGFDSNETPPISDASEGAQAGPGNAVGQGSMGVKPDRMLFADSLGNPVPLSQGPQYLLFPDGRGNLIPVPSQPSSSPYMLFPDSNGKPVPASSQAPQYLLFPDGDGRLTPVPSGAH